MVAFRHCHRSIKHTAGMEPDSRSNSEELGGRSASYRPKNVSLLCFDDAMVQRRPDAGVWYQCHIILGCTKRVCTVQIMCAVYVDGWTVYMQQADIGPSASERANEKNANNLKISCIRRA